MSERNEQPGEGRPHDASLSGAHFQAVAESTRDAIITADGDGLILYSNKAATRLFGYAPEELVGQPLTILMPDRFKALHLAGLSRFKTTHEARVVGRTVELFGLTSDGREFPIELSLSTWRDGGKIYFAGIVRDTTERKRAESAVRDSERRYRQLFEDAPVAMFITTTDGTIATANQPALNMFRFTREAIVGMNVASRFVDSTDRAAFREAIGTGSIKGFEVRLLRADDTAVNVLLSATRLLDESGESLGIQGILQEVTADRGADSVHPLRSAPGPTRDDQPDRPVQGTPPVESTPIPVSPGSLAALVGGHVQFEIAAGDPIAYLKFHNWIRGGDRATFVEAKGMLHGKTMVHVEMNHPMPLSTLVNSPFVADVEELAIDTGRIIGTSRIDHRYALTLSGL